MPLYNNSEFDNLFLKGLYIKPLQDLSVLSASTVIKKTKIYIIVQKVSQSPPVFEDLIIEINGTRFFSIFTGNIILQLNPGDIINQLAYSANPPVYGYYDITAF